MRVVWGVGAVAAVGVILKLAWDVAWLKFELRSSSRCRYLVVRLLPGQDLASELEKAVAAAQCRAVTVVSCVGSLRSATLRLASAEKPGSNPTKTVEERFEIVSLTGTLEFNPKTGAVTRHLHLALADKIGAVWGGHVLSGIDGAAALLPIFTTAEVCAT
jgi:predicted DNA-binding protein with PD1-like motif